MAFLRLAASYPDPCTRLAKRRNPIQYGDTGYHWVLWGKICPKTCTTCHRACTICTWTRSVYAASNDCGTVETERGHRGEIFNVRGDSRWMGLARVLCASTVVDRWRLKSDTRLSAHQ